MHYVIGDIHCQIDALTILLEKLHLQDDDEVYFVGDWFDRAYTTSDYICTVEWMAANLTEGTKFKSVLGNHDMSLLRMLDDYINDYGREDGIAAYLSESMLFSADSVTNLVPLFNQMYDILKNMPLYYMFDIQDVEYIVTHSWLVDEHGNGIGTKAFNMGKLSEINSVWDRDFSVYDFDCETDIPVIIHGHTPTLGKNDFFSEGVTPLTKIMYISDKNINIDCCAFRSPMLGGNLAAYRCDDGQEYYAYEDTDFYNLADMWDESEESMTRRFSKQEYLFIVLFYNRYASALADSNADLLTFNHEMAKEAFMKMKSLYKVESNDEYQEKCFYKLMVLKKSVINRMTEVWVTQREEYLEGRYSYPHSYDILSQDIIAKLLGDH